MKALSTWRIIATSRLALADATEDVEFAGDGAWIGLPEALAVNNGNA
jgi:hypothetical protein